MSTIIISFIVVASVQFGKIGEFGEFKNKFKDCQSQLFIPLLFVYRVSLGLYSSLRHDNEYSTIFMLGISIVFNLYIIINLPFIDVFQNYRTAAIHITTIFIIITADYYRTMKSNTPMSIKGRLYGPAIAELVMIGICIAISFVVLVWEIYQYIKSCRNSKIKDSGDANNAKEVDRSQLQLTRT